MPERRTAENGDDSSDLLAFGRNCVALETESQVTVSRTVANHTATQPFPE